MRHIFLFVALVSCSLLSGQGIDFFKGTWEEALTKASAEDKLIFVDGYAAWCGPCKRMSADVFPNPVVGEYFNENFVNMKIDLEKGIGVDFRKKYPVRAFPTLFFINGSGKVVMKQTGAKRAGDLVTMGKAAMGKANQSQAYMKLYEEGDRSYKTMYNLVKHLNRSGKPTLKYANEYIDSQTDLSTPDNLAFILEATTEADSRIFDLLIEHRDEIISLQGKENVTHKIYSAGMATTLNAANLESEDLFKSTQKQIVKAIPEQAGVYKYYSSMHYYKTSQQPDEFLKIAKKYYKKDLDQSAVKRHGFVKELHSNWKKSPEVMNFAESIAADVAEVSGEANHLVTLAMIQKDNGKKDLALKTLENALVIAKETNANTKNIKRLIDSFNTGA